MESKLLLILMPLLLLILSALPPQVHALDSGETVIHKSLIIHAPKSLVWSALTTESGLNKWWGKGVKLEPFVGGEFYEPWGDGQLATGTVLRVEPQEFVEFSWQEKYWNPPENTVCIFSLEQTQEFTTLTVKHRGWESFQDPEVRAQLIEGFHNGWDFLLPKLQKYVESEKYQNTFSN